MLRDLFNDLRLVDEAGDTPFGFPQGGEIVEPHLPPTLGTG